MSESKAVRRSVRVGAGREEGPRKGAAVGRIVLIRNGRLVALAGGGRAAARDAVLR